MHACTYRGTCLVSTCLSMFILDNVLPRNNFRHVKHVHIHIHAYVHHNIRVHTMHNNLPAQLQVWELV